MASFLESLMAAREKASQQATQLAEQRVRLAEEASQRMSEATNADIEAVKDAVVAVADLMETSLTPALALLPTTVKKSIKEKADAVSAAADILRGNGGE